MTAAADQDEDSASNAASDIDEYWAEGDDNMFDASSPTSRKHIIDFSIEALNLIYARNFRFLQ